MVILVLFPEKANFVSNNLSAVGRCINLIKKIFFSEQFKYCLSSQPLNDIGLCVSPCNKTGFCGLLSQNKKKKRLLPLKIIYFWQKQTEAQSG